jgi:hypothetical protein
MMAWKRKVAGGVLAMVGFMLSPLSWWNDLFVNVPIAIGLAWLASLVYKPAFATALLLGYWLTNGAFSEPSMAGRQWGELAELTR